SWGELVFGARPGVSVLRVSWDVPELFEALDEGKEPHEPARREAALLVYRPRFAPEIEELEQEEAQALEDVLSGRAFAEVCTALTAPDEDVAAASSRAAQYLAGWLNRELLSSARLKTA